MIPTEIEIIKEIVVQIGRTVRCLSVVNVTVSWKAIEDRIVNCHYVVTHMIPVKISEKLHDAFPVEGSSPSYLILGEAVE